MLRFGQNAIVEAETLLTSAIEKGIRGSELEKANKALAQLAGAKEKFATAVTAKESGDAAQAIVLFEEILDAEGFSSDAAANLAMLYA